MFMDGKRLPIARVTVLPDPPVLNVYSDRAARILTPLGVKCVSRLDDTLNS